MSNPLKNWKHAKQRVDPKEYLHPLLQDPVWDSDKSRWVGLYYLNLRNGQAIPNLYGKLFSWNETLYVADDQLVVCDPVLTRTLEYEKRADPGKHILLWVYLVLEEDDYFVMVKGLARRT